MAGWDYTTASPEEVAAEVKVCILVPHRDEDDNRLWHRHFVALERFPVTGSLEMRGFSLTTNREQLVKTALQDGLGYTHIFFLDDDVLPPINIIPALVGANLDIVCGLYMAKKKKSERGLAAWIKVPNSRGQLAPITLEQEGRYVEVDVTGLGCCMIKRHVFESMTEPWFRWDIPPAPSEDFYFFFKAARELGIRPIIDMEAKCNHIGKFAIDCEGGFDTLEV